jgi:hypothetical protein
MDCRDEPATVFMTNSTPIRDDFTRQSERAVAAE